MHKNVWAFTRAPHSETQERTFGQCNSITHKTSYNHPQHVIDNALLQIQAESSKLLSSLPKQEAEISQLAKVLPTFENTFFSHECISTHSLQFQSHLERISDYLLLGPGVWWKETSLGIKLFDRSKEEDLGQQCSIFAPQTLVLLNNTYFNAGTNTQSQTYTYL